MTWVVLRHIWRSCSHIWLPITAKLVQKLPSTTFLEKPCLTTWPYYHAGIMLLYTNSHVQKMATPLAVLLSSAHICVCAYAYIVKCLCTWLLVVVLVLVQTHFFSGILTHGGSLFVADNQCHKHAWSPMDVVSYGHGHGMSTNSSLSRWNLCMLFVCLNV